MAKKMKTRKGKDGFDYPYTSPDIVIDENGKSATKKFEELSMQYKDIANYSLAVGDDGLLYLSDGKGNLLGDGIDVKKMQEVVSNLVSVFTADFSGVIPLASQFYAWENRVYGSAIYDALSNIQCIDNVAHLTSVYDSENSRWKKQMMCTGGLFESDNFICEFEAKFDGKAGSWQNVITYGTGTHWTNGMYSDGVKWPAGGEIDAFEQAGGYSNNPNYFYTPTVHYGSGTGSGYPNTHETTQGDSVIFTTNEWHKFKFELLNGNVKIWIEDILVGENNFSNCVVNNNYLCDYKPFLKPQAFYIDGSCADNSDTSNSYDFSIKNFKIYQEKNVKCTGLEIYPQMWQKGTELIFPTNVEVFFDKVFTPSNTSNKACKWESTNPSVATVCEGYVKTLTEGTTTIKATCGSATATYSLTVNNASNIPCAKISIDSQDLNMSSGSETTLTYYKYPNFTTDTVTFNSTSPSVATINNNGKITTLSNGHTSIEIICGGKKDSISLEVLSSTEPAIKYNLDYAGTKIEEIYNNWENDKTNKSLKIENLGSLGESADTTLHIVESSELMFPRLNCDNLSTPSIQKNNTWMWIIKGYNPATINQVCQLKLNSTTNENDMPTIDYSTSDKTISIRYGSVNLKTLTSVPNIIVIGHDEQGYYLWIDGKVSATGGSKTDAGYLYDVYGLQLSNLGAVSNNSALTNMKNFMNNFKTAVYLNARTDIETILTKDFNYSI